MKASGPVGAGGARPESWVRAATAPPIRARLAPSARRRGEDRVEAAATGARIQALIAPDTPPVTTAAPAPQVAHSTRMRDCRRSSRRSPTAKAARAGTAPAARASQMGRPTTPGVKAAAPVAKITVASQPSRHRCAAPKAPVDDEA